MDINCPDGEEKKTLISFSSRDLRKAFARCHFSSYYAYGETVFNIIYSCGNAYLLTGASNECAPYPGGITMVSVRYGLSKLTLSPARLPGMGKRRADRGLRYFVASAATSKTMAASASTCVSPGNGTTSRPVPQTLEYSSSSEIPNLPSAAR